MNQLKIRLKDWGFALCITQTAFVLVATYSNRATETNNVPTIPLTKTNSPECVWNLMKSCLNTNSIQGAVACFSIASKDEYQQAFSSLSKTDMVTYAKGLGPLKKVSIENDKAELYFTNTVAGNIITFPVEFDKENGQWKIMGF